jgi:hypothetical protein
MLQEGTIEAPPTSIIKIVKIANVSSAPLDRRTEYICVIPVVISELKLSDVKMQIFLANLMISTDNPALQDRPEAFNRIGVNCANDMLTNGVINGLVREAVLQSYVAGVSIGAEKANAVRYGFSDESFKRFTVCVLNDASNDIALALDCADYGSLASITAPSLAAFFVPMSVLVAAANVGFVNLYDSAKLLDVLDHGGSNLVAHEPSSLVRAKAHIAKDLESAHALLADQHQVGDSVPVFQRLIRVFKDCAGQVREAIAGFWGALVALPMPWVALQLGWLWRAATRADDTLRPAPNDQIRNAVVLSLKERIELWRCQLVDCFWVGGTSHNEFLPLSERNMAWA